MEKRNDKYVKKDSFLVVLDSRNASDYYNGSALSNISFDVKSPIQIPQDCIYMTWVVNNFVCPVSFYLINSTNNMLSLSVFGVTTKYYFPVGNYNANSFMKAFLLLLPSYTITLNTCNNKFTITGITDFTINSESTIKSIIGMDKISLTSESNILTMPYCCNFGGLNSFNIKCGNIRTSNLDSEDSCTTSNIIAAIPVNAASNGVIYYEKRNDFEFEVKETTIDEINILIEDDLLNPIDFNNQHWNLILQVNYIREIRKDIETSFFDIVNNYQYSV